VSVDQSVYVVCQTVEKSFESVVFSRYVHVVLECRFAQRASLTVIASHLLTICSTLVELCRLEADVGQISPTACALFLLAACRIDRGRRTRNAAVRTSISREVAALGLTVHRCGR